MPTVKYLNEAKTQELITEIKTRLATKVTHYSSMPLASAALSGQIVQYIGTTNQYYTEGDFYRCDYDENADPQAVWTKISYNKSEIDSLVTSAGHFEVVNTLPTTNISTNTIYLVPKTETLSGYTGTSSGTTTFVVMIGTALSHVYDVYTGTSISTLEFDHTASTTSEIEEIDGYIDDHTYASTSATVPSKELNNVKTEWINLDGTSNGWEKIGETSIDLRAYVKFENLVPITTQELEAMWADV